MALINSHILSDARGSIGNDVYSRNASGNIIRSRGSLVDPETTAQVAARDRFDFLINRWQTLSDSRRLGWNEYAARLRLKNRLGGPKRLSGFGAYMRVNNVRYNLGWTSYLFDDPPESAAMAAQPIIDFTLAVWDISDALLLLQGTANCYDAPASYSSQNVLFAYVSNAMPVTLYRYYSSWLYIGYTYIPARASHPFSFSESDTRTIWNTAGGDICFMKFVVSYADGRLSKPVLARLLTTSRA
jgi:hypothetical protein